MHMDARHAIGRKRARELKTHCTAAPIEQSITVRYNAVGCLHLCNVSFLNASISYGSRSGTDSKLAGSCATSAPERVGVLGKEKRKGD